MNKKFLAKVVLATVLVGGINLLPLSNLDVGNIQISVAYAESKNFSAKEGAMTDVEYIEAQAKEASRLRALEAVKEKIASYVRNFSGAKGKLTEDDIAAIAEKFEQVGTAKYKKLFYNAVDEDGKELGKVGIMYEATVTAKFNSKNIMEHIKLTEQEKAKRIRQAKEARAKFEELDREYEELRKNARTKTPEQLQGEIKNFDDKISDLEKSREKNKSAKKDKSIKKDKPTTQQDKIHPMRFSNPVEIGGFGWGNLNHGGAVITGASYVSETPIKHGKDVARWEYSKGVARFGDGKESVYLHYAKGTDFKIGSEAVNSTILYNHMWTTIFKVSAKNGYTMYFLKQHFDSPAPAYHYILIGYRPDGKWVKYFDTEDLCKQYMGKSKNVSIQKVTSNGDTIIVNYSRCNRPSYGDYFYEKEADEFGEFRFKWDESAKWFGVEKITYNQKPTEHKPAQENKPVTNQPMQFSQPVEIGWMGWSQRGGGFACQKATENTGDYYTKYNKNNIYTYGRGRARFDNGDDAIYVHYDYYRNEKTHEGTINFGSQKINNTISFVILNTWIYKIPTNSKIKIYAIREFYSNDSDWKIVGTKQNGEFVQYIDTKFITEKYFGVNTNGGASPVIYDIPKCNGDTIVIQCRKSTGSIKNSGIIGEFRFKWDEKAQWFSIEHIKY